MNQTRALTEYVCTEFRKLSDSSKAVEMAAYMKTDMPFYGVQKPLRVAVYRDLFKRFPATSQRDYEANIRALWNLPMREDKYTALAYATKFKTFMTFESIPLYEQLVREGAWWDFVDDIATHMVGQVLLTERKLTKPVLEQWIDDPDLWIRRTAILAHNRHKKETDEDQLYDHILRRAHEKEFFIRKAIGWALREYSYANPESVRTFIKRHETKLSNLSVREGLKQLNRAR
jgi:3-methyladenine DNA glycosylase AlkD